MVNRKNRMTPEFKLSSNENSSKDIKRTKSGVSKFKVGVGVKKGGGAKIKLQK